MEQAGASLPRIGTRGGHIGDVLLEAEAAALSRTVAGVLAFCGGCARLSIEFPLLADACTGAIRKWGAWKDRHTWGPDLDGEPARRSLAVAPRVPDANVVVGARLTDW
jgi:hypothetical protein